MMNATHIRLPFIFFVSNVIGCENRGWGWRSWGSVWPLNLLDPWVKARDAHTHTALSLSLWVFSILGWIWVELEQTKSPFWLDWEEGETTPLGLNVTELSLFPLGLRVRHAACSGVRPLVKMGSPPKQSYDSEIHPSDAMPMVVLIKVHVYRTRSEMYMWVMSLHLIWAGNLSIWAMGTNL